MEPNYEPLKELAIKGLKWGYVVYDKNNNNHTVTHKLIEYMKEVAKNHFEEVLNMIYIRSSQYTDVVGYPYLTPVNDHYWDEVEKTYQKHGGLLAQGDLHLVVGTTKEGGVILGSF